MSIDKGLNLIYFMNILCELNGSSFWHIRLIAIAVHGECLLNSRALLTGCFDLSLIDYVIIVVKTNLGSVPFKIAISSSDQLHKVL